MNLPPPVPPGLAPGGRHARWDPAVPRYVACDVDGTLIGPEPAPTAAVLAALTALEGLGVRVGVATGRARPSLAPLIERAGLSGPHVFHNGAQVVDGGRVVMTRGLEPESTDRLLALAASRDDVDIEVYTADGFRSATMDPRSRAHWELIGRDPDGPIARAADLGDADAVKATFVLYDPTARDEVVAAVRALGLTAGPAGSPRTPHLMYVNVTHPGTGKDVGLRAAAAHLGVPLGATAAIGDEENDVAMLGIAGTAIAMGQAADDVRGAAHLVAPPVEDDGAAVALGALAAMAQRPPGTW